MPKYTAPEDIILRLRTALEAADRKLELVLAQNGQKEWGYAGTVCYGVRRVIRAGLSDCFPQDRKPAGELGKTPGTLDLQDLNPKLRRRK